MYDNGPGKTRRGKANNHNNRRNTRPGNSIQRAAARDLTPAPTVRLTPLPGRPLHRRGNARLQRLRRVNGEWKREDDDGDIFMADGTRPDRSIGSPSPSPAYNRRSPRPASEDQINSLIHSLRHLQKELNNLPSSLRIDELRNTSQRAADKINKLAVVALTKDDVENRPTFRYVNNEIGSLHDRLHELEQRSQLPMREQDGDILKLALENMKKGDILLEQIVWEAERRLEEVRATVIQADQRSTLSEESLRVVREELEALREIVKDVPLVLSWAKYESALTDDRQQLNVPAPISPEFAHINYFATSPEVADPAWLTRHTHTRIIQLSTASAQLGHGLLPPAVLEILVAPQRSDIETPLQAVSIYLQAIAIILDLCVNRNLAFKGEEGSALDAIRLYSSLYPIAREHLIALARENGDLITGSDSCEVAYIFLFQRLTDLAAKARVPFIHVSTGEDYLGVGRNQRWLPHLDRRPNSFIPQLPLVIDAVHSTHAEDPISNFYLALKIARLFNRKFNIYSIFTIPLFERVAVDPAGEEYPAPVIVPFHLQTAHGVTALILRWITRNVWDVASPTPGLNDGVDLSKVDRTLEICREVSLDLKGIFGALVAASGSAHVPEELAELSSAASLYFLALVALNSRIPTHLQYTVHRGTPSSAYEAPGTQLPWLSRALSSHIPKPFVPRSSMSISDPESSDSEVDDDDRLTLVDRDDLPDYSDARSFRAVSAPI